MTTNRKPLLILVIFSMLLISPQSDRNIEKIDGLRSIELLNEEAEMLEKQLNNILNSLEKLTN